MSRTRNRVRYSYLRIMLPPTRCADASDDRSTELIKSVRCPSVPGGLHRRYCITSASQRAYYVPVRINTEFHPTPSLLRLNYNKTCSYTRLLYYYKNDYFFLIPPFAKRGSRVSVNYAKRVICGQIIKTFECFPPSPSRPHRAIEENQRATAPHPSLVVIGKTFLPCVENMHGIDLNRRAAAAKTNLSIRYIIA